MRFRKTLSACAGGSASQKSSLQNPLHLPIREFRNCGSALEPQCLLVVYIAKRLHQIDAIIAMQAPNALDSIEEINHETCTTRFARIGRGPCDRPDRNG